MRVVAGRFGGRTLVAPSGSGTRPTPDRVREALFSILGDVSGARVLDLWAGTGALGIEALSRGATHATFVESGKPAIAALRKNLDALGIRDEARLVVARVESLPRKLEEHASFDLVLADPPYAAVRDGSAPRAIAALVAAGWLAAGAPLVLEHASADAPPAIAGLVATDSRRYGDTSLSFYAG